MNEILTGLTTFGPLGIALGAAYWYILNLEKRHDREREEWRTIAREGATAIKELTSALSTFKQYLESTREKK